MIQINKANIPAELIERKQWVLWKIVKRDGNDTKVPYQLNGAGAKSNDPATWSDFESIYRRYLVGGWHGIGFVFSADDPYVGVDLDGCRNPDTNEVVPWAKKLVLDFASYAEVSPSGTGVKLWVRGRWPYQGGHKVILDDVEKITGKTPAIEVYESVRYFAVTGRVLARQNKIADRQEQLDAIRKQFWKEEPNTAPVHHGEWRSEASVIDRARKYLAKMDTAVSGQDGHGTTFKAACALVLGFDLSTGDALGLLHEWNQGCQPPWSDRDLKHKVDDAARQNGERGYLRNVAPQNYERVPMPEYRQKPQNEPEQHDEPKDDVQVTLLDDAARAYLKTVTDGGAKLLSLGLPNLDAAIGGGVEPGEMIIFAARPSHGKSMAAQQVVYNFISLGIPAMIVSEEMSHLMLGKRAIQFASEAPAEHWAARAESVSRDIDAHFAGSANCFVLEGCRNVNRVVEQIRRFVAEQGVGLAVVDYAQLLAGNGKGRYDQITQVSIELKKVAAECKIPVIVLCQMSRSIEGRDSYLPRMSDLKESGQFEQDADVIVFQAWPYKLDPDKHPPEEYWLFVGKNRNRGIHSHMVKCKFLPGRQKLVYDTPVKPEADDFDPVNMDWDQMQSGTGF